MKKFFDAIEKVLQVIVVLLAIALIVDVVLQIVGRFVLVRPVSWTEELSRFLLGGIVCFATPLVARRDKYIRVDMLLNKLPERVRKIWIMILDIIVAIFLAVVAYNAISYVQLGGIQKSAVLKIPMTITFSTVLIGPALTSLFFVEKAINTFKSIVKDVKS